MIVMVALIATTRIARGIAERKARFASTVKTTTKMASLIATMKTANEIHARATFALTPRLRVSAKME